ncbi:MAG: hypothetical protein JRG97_02850 [Deltaproteobacteria bacterium]|nr:hypothetical protein [Deltaproteobacteria bacterium]MBW2051370.1 hypothetical protein [Deltaproteobacteria bacterium]MBW2139995.1 hypothetical protein [Deltaproteobacteria bacterium]MBW2323961.1 hypothetical protein [Deltaproteobacteria bacterium]
MKKKWPLIAALGICLVLTGIYVGISTAADVPRITKEQSKEMLGDPDVVIIDVRVQNDFKGSELKIMGSVRENPDKTAKWAGKYNKNKTYVIYCA